MFIVNIANVVIDDVFVEIGNSLHFEWLKSLSFFHNISFVSFVTFTFISPYSFSSLIFLQ